MMQQGNEGALVARPRGRALTDGRDGTDGVAQFEFDCFEGRPTTRCCVVCKSKISKTTCTALKDWEGRVHDFAKRIRPEGRGAANVTSKIKLWCSSGLPLRWVGSCWRSCRPSAGADRARGRLRKWGSNIRITKNNASSAAYADHMGAAGLLPGYKGQHEAEPTWRQTRRNLPGRDRRLPRSVPTTACSIRWENTVLSAG